MRTLAHYVAIVLVAVGSAQAREDGNWSRGTEMVRQWFAELMRPDNPSLSCCGEADAYESDEFTQSPDGHYEAVITREKAPYAAGTHIFIPDEKIKWDKGNPTGHGWIFIGSEKQIYCYVTPSGA